MIWPRPPRQFPSTTGKSKYCRGARPISPRILVRRSRGTRSSGGSAADMAAELIVAAEAELDVADAYGWYEARRVGLGEEFLSCVDACIQSVCRTPELHAFVHENYRRALVRRFPYAV